MGEESFTEVKQEVLNGSIYESHNGQLVIDYCPSDEAHLLAPATRTSQPLYDCRHYLRDLVPKEWIGKQGRFIVDRTSARDGTPLTVAITFIPKAELAPRGGVEPPTQGL